MRHRGRDHRDRWRTGCSWLATSWGFSRTLVDRQVNYNLLKLFLWPVGLRSKHRISLFERDSDPIAAVVSFSETKAAGMQKRSQQLTQSLLSRQRACISYQIFGGFFRQIACQPNPAKNATSREDVISHAYPPRNLILRKELYEKKKKKKKEQVSSSRNRPHYALYPHRFPESLTFSKHILHPFQHKSILDAPPDMKELSQILLGLVFFLVFNGLADQFESVN